MPGACLGRERERKVSFIELGVFSKPAMFEPMWYDAGVLTTVK
jgi:hypothetical protein